MSVPDERKPDIRHSTTVVSRENTLVLRRTGVFLLVSEGSIPVLPTLVGALYWPASTKAGALASTITGSVISGLGLAARLFGRTALLPFPWTHIDPLIYALPATALVFVTVSLLTQKPATHYLGGHAKKVA